MATSHPSNNFCSTTSGSTSDSGQTTSLSVLKTIYPTLWYRIHVLLFDLQHYTQRADSRNRLETVVDPLYLGAPYFETQEAEAIRTADCGGRTLSQTLQTRLDERLNRRMEKRVESGDFRVCAAHDLAPVLGEQLGVDLKRLSKEKTFINLLNTKGLDLGDARWEGLSRKSFAPKARKK